MSQCYEQCKNTVLQNKGLKGYLELLNPQNGLEGNTDIKLVTIWLIFL